MENDAKSETKNSEEKEKLDVPQAIVIVGLIIGVAILLANWKAPARQEVSLAPQPPNTTTQLEKLRPIMGTDHVRGNPNAPVVFVEFSDLECPFCKQFHMTMQQIMAEYGPNGRVAWVYRHFPLDRLHPKARKEAEATECAAELGGNEAFWAYTDKIFEITPANNELDLNLLPQIAEELGLPRQAFEECLASGRHADRVDEDVREAIAIGAQGTPFSVIVSGDTKVPIFGAVPYDRLRLMIEDLL